MTFRSINIKYPVFIFTFYYLIFSSSSVIAQAIKLGLPVGHTLSINSAKFSTDGKKIVTTSSDNTAKLWDAATGKLLYSIEGHTYPVHSAEFSPDGKRILTASWDSTAKIWDAATGTLQYSLEGHTDWVWSAVFSPDGRTIVTASSDSTAIIWDAATGKLLFRLEGHKDIVHSAIYSPDGKTIVTVSNDNTAKLWDAATYKLLHSLDEYVWSAAFSPDGKSIVTACSDNKARVWDATSGILLNILEGHTESVNMALFSPDSRTIVTASSDSTAKIWDAATGIMITSLEGHTDIINSATFSPDGKTIITAASKDIFTSPPDDDNTAILWDAETGKLLYRLEGHTDDVNSAIFSPDGKSILTISDDKTAKTWDVATGKLLNRLEGHTDWLLSARFSSDGNVVSIISKDGNIKLWDPVSGRMLHNLEGHADKYSYFFLSSVFSPDGKNIITIHNKTIKLWDIASGELIHIMEGHTDHIYTAVFNSDSGTIISASSDHTIRFWDASSGKLLKSLERLTDDIISADLSPDGKTIVTISDNNTVNIVDVATGKLLFNLKGNIKRILSATFSPDGKSILTTSEDCTAKLWNSKTGEMQMSLEGNTDAVKSASVSPDRKKIVTVSADRIVRLWDAATGKLLHNLEGHTESVTYAAFSPNGKTVVTTSFDTKCKFWDVETGEELLSLILIDSTDWAIIHQNGLFDASPEAMMDMYFVQGFDIINFEQLKNRYWEPGLWQKVINGEDLRISPGLNERLKLFPEVQIAEIDNNGKLPVTLFKRDGGIGKVKILVNGKEVADDARGPGLDTSNQVVTFFYDLKNHPYFIPGKENTIEVVAYERDNWLSSRGAKIYHTVESTQEISHPELFVISIGISDYEGDQIDLKYAAKDAQDMTAALMIGGKSLFGTDLTYVCSLNSGAGMALQPTKTNIIKVFNEITEKAKAEDVIVVYLAGHGINYGGADGDFYFLTKEAYTADPIAYSDPSIRNTSTLSSQELTELIKKVPALKQVLIIDACASGRVVDDLLAKRDGLSSNTIRALDRMKDRTGMHILTGSAADAVSYEANRYGQGILTYSLLEGIRGAALRENRYVDIASLFQYARDRVPELAAGIGGIQQPQLISPYGASSFDIGLVEDADKSKVPLASIKTVFVRSTLIDLEEMEDILGLTGMTDDLLSEKASRAPDKPFIFLDVRQFPDACRISGGYNQKEGVITLKARLRCREDTNYEINLKANDAGDLVEKLVEEVEKKIIFNQY